MRLRRMSVTTSSDSVSASPTRLQGHRGTTCRSSPSWGLVSVTRVRMTPPTATVTMATRETMRPRRFIAGQSAVGASRSPWPAGPPARWVRRFVVAPGAGVDATVGALRRRDAPGHGLAGGADVDALRDLEPDDVTLGRGDEAVDAAAWS